MNERHAYKIPQLNKWGVIDSTVLEIKIPSTVDASFLDIIKSNPHASFLYDNISYTLETVDEVNKKATFFATSSILWSDFQTKLWQPNLSFTFELPTTYSTGVYTYKIEFSELSDETWSRYTGSHTIASTDNQLTITLATELIYRYRVTVSAKTYFVIGKVLTIDFTGETPNISLSETALQGGSGGGSVSVDAILSTTSTNPVQNRVITSALNDKATVDTQYSFREGEILISGTEESCTIIGSGRALVDFVSKQERRQQSIIKLTEDNISTVKEIVTQNPGALIRYEEYIYVPTYRYSNETIPGFYACCAADESTLYYLVINWDEASITEGSFSLEEVGIQIDDLTQL